MIGYWLGDKFIITGLQLSAIADALGKAPHDETNKKAWAEIGTVITQQKVKDLLNGTYGKV